MCICVCVCVCVFEGVDDLHGPTCSMTMSPCLADVGAVFGVPFERDPCVFRLEGCFSLLLALAGCGAVFFAGAGVTCCGEFCSAAWGVPCAEPEAAAFLPELFSCDPGIFFPFFPPECCCWAMGLSFPEPLLPILGLGSAACEEVDVTNESVSPCITRRLCLCPSLCLSTSCSSSEESP
jgi:hypothetical protein